MLSLLDLNVEQQIKASWNCQNPHSFSVIKQCRLTLFILMVLGNHQKLGTLVYSSPYLHKHSRGWCQRIKTSLAISVVPILRNKNNPRKKSVDDLKYKLISLDKFFWKLSLMATCRIKENETEVATLVAEVVHGTIALSLYQGMFL